MLTRRHIRVKVMQSIYAFNQSNNDSLQVEQRFLTKSMEEMYDLFLLQLSLLVEIKKKAEEAHQNIQSLAKQSQEKHEKTKAKSL